MALTGKLVLKSDLGVDLTISDAYVRVSSVRVDKSMGVAEIEVLSDKTAGVVRRFDHGFEYSLDSGKNAIEQAYLSMKTVSRFSGLQDC